MAIVSLKASKWASSVLRKRRCVFRKKKNCEGGGKKKI